MTKNKRKQQAVGKHLVQAIEAALADFSVVGLTGGQARVATANILIAAVASIHVNLFQERPEMAGELDTWIHQTIEEWHTMASKAENAA